MKRTENALEQIRRRPGMYVGGTEAYGLHQLLWEAVGNVIDLHLAQQLTTMHVELTPDGWVTVYDDGPGMSPAVVAEAFTTLHLGGTFDGHLPHVHVTQGMRGLGVVVINALSSDVVVETTFEGVRYRHSFASTKAAPVETLGPSTTEGTSMRFRPDPKIFRTLAFDTRIVRERLQELAWLNPLLRVFWQGERLSGRGGLLGWANSIATQRHATTATFATRDTVDHVSVDIALVWADGITVPVIHSFVNQNRSTSGTHVDGLWAGFAAHANAQPGKKRRRLSIEAVQERASWALIAIIHVGLLHPSYRNPTREHLASPEAGIAVARTLERGLPVAASIDARLREQLTHWQ